MTKPTEIEILQAFQESGYLMEQEVASVCERLGFRVVPNHAFRDLDEGISRETDVWARKRFFYHELQEIAVFAELFVECKNTSAPIVFLTRNRDAEDAKHAPQEIVFPLNSFDATNSGTTVIRRVSAFEHWNLARYHYRFKASRKAVKFAKVVKEKIDG